MQKKKSLGRGSLLLGYEEEYLTNLGWRSSGGIKEWYSTLWQMS